MHIVVINDASSKRISGFSKYFFVAVTSFSGSVSLEPILEPFTVCVFISVYFQLACRCRGSAEKDVVECK